MKKTIIHKEIYESPLCREYILATQIGMLQQNSPSAVNPGSNTEDFNPSVM